MATATKPAEDLLTLAARLREKGLSDADLESALTNLGYSKAQARDAVRFVNTPEAEETPAPSASGVGDAEGGSAAGTTPSTRTPRRAPPRSKPPAKPSRGRSLRSIERNIDRGLSEARGLTLTPPKRITVQTGAGFVGGLVLYILALNYLRYGPEGVRGWLAAKFLNQPMSPAAKGQGFGDKRDDTPAGNDDGRNDTYLPTTRARRAANSQEV